MDKKINKIIETYVTTYKQEIKKAVSFAEQDKIGDLIESMLWNTIVLKKEEFKSATKNPT
jgi:hypothetical protein